MGGACTVWPAGACAITTEGDTAATRAAKSNTTAHTVRLQDGHVIGPLSIPMVTTGSRLTSLRTGVKDMLIRLAHARPWEAIH